MLKWRKMVVLALLLLGGPAELPAATSSTLDILPDDRAGDAVDLGQVRPVARPNREPLLLGGNPLWSVPLSMLTATQERPLFSASRRPPQRAVVTLPVEQPPPAPKPPQPDLPPPLALIGAIVGQDEAIALFVDRTDQKMVRLRRGESHAGWVLSAIAGRTVTLNKGSRSEILALNPTDASASVPELPGAPTAIGGASYAPFVPRSTPKNGESDGL